METEKMKKQIGGYDLKQKSRGLSTAKMTADSRRNLTNTLHDNQPFYAKI